MSCMGFGRSLGPESVLAIRKDVTHLQVFHYMAMDYMFKYLGCDTS